MKNWTSSFLTEAPEVRLHRGHGARVEIPRGRQQLRLPTRRLGAACPSECWHAGLTGADTANPQQRCACKVYEVRGSDLDLKATPAATDEDRRPMRSALVDDGR